MDTHTHKGTRRTINPPVRARLVLDAFGRVRRWVEGRRVQMIPGRAAKVVIQVWVAASGPVIVGVAAILGQAAQVTAIGHGGWDFTDGFF